MQLGVAEELGGAESVDREHRDVTLSLGRCHATFHSAGARGSGDCTTSSSEKSMSGNGRIAGECYL